MILGMKPSKIEKKGSRTLLTRGRTGQTGGKFHGF